MNAARLAAACLVLAVAGCRFRPSNERDWSEDVARLPEVRIEGARVKVLGVRNFDYRTPSDWTARYYDADFDLEELESVWYIVEPFAPGGLAHAFLSFGFRGERYLAVSVEVRRLRGEEFSPWRGLWNNYELTYVLADERDVVRLRSNYRKHDVFVYPIRVSREKARELFVDVMRRAESLRSRPEFYNTLTNTCASNILRHVNRVSAAPIRWSWRVLLPGYSDRMAYAAGLIDTDLPFERARERFLVSERARRADRDPAFSALIRR